ncbi:MAG TPA: LCP family protein [Trueperaceae bacterium]|nr:LCP family protein [Trueperaceae bacterium]
MTRRRARLVSLAGVLVALAGLVGYWLSRDVDRATLSTEQRRLIGLDADEFHASFVVAGRDIAYGNEGALPIYAQDGTIIGWRPINGYSSTEGTNTDTILYVDIRGDDITLVAVPRDLWMDDLGYRINAAYHLGGAEGLRRRVEAVLGVPIDYYAVIKLDIFQNLVDALGGVEIDVPYPMHYDDDVGNVHIHFDEGRQHMDGEDASLFIRYRQTLRGDIDRIDNVKRLAYAMLQRLQELNIRAVTLVPSLMDTYFEDVETNASPTLVRQLATRIPNLRLTTTATLPVEEATTSSGAQVVTHEATVVNAFMAETFGGVARDFSSPPDVRLIITDSSGLPGLGEWYRDNLIAHGIPEELIALRSAGDVEPGPTRLFATFEAWSQADYYAELLHAGKQEVARLTPHAGQATVLELVLGADAASRVDHATAVMANLGIP